jgi:hypothetical protein
LPSGEKLIVVGPLPSDTKSGQRPVTAGMKAGSGMVEEPPPLALPLLEAPPLEAPPPAPGPAPAPPLPGPDEEAPAPLAPVPAGSSSPHPLATTRSEETSRAPPRDLSMRRGYTSPAGRCSAG